MMRKVGVPNQVPGRLHLTRTHRDSRDARYVQLAAGHLDWVPQRLEDAIGRGRGIQRVNRILDDHGELVPTQASRGIGCTQALRDPLTDY